MSIKSAIQDAMKDALRNKEQERLECLRMAKGALLLKEKASAKDHEITDDESTQALRAEVRKRQQSLEQFRELGKGEEADRTEREIAIIEEFLPRQLSADDVEGKVREYLDANPDMNHPGKLTGAMKKELGDLVDGKVLNEMCRKVLEG